MTIKARFRQIGTVSLGTSFASTQNKVRRGHKMNYNIKMNLAMLVPMANLCVYLLVSEYPRFSIVERPNECHIAMYTTYRPNP